MQNGAKLWLWDCIGKDNQRWSYDGGLVRYTANPSYCIDIPGGKAAKGTPLWLWQCGSWTVKWSTQKSTRTALPLPRVARDPWLHRLLAHAHRDAAGGDGSLNSASVLPSVNRAAAVGVPWHEQVSTWYASQATGVVLPLFQNGTIIRRPPRPPTTFVHNRRDAHSL